MEINNHKEAARVVSLELKAVSTPPSRKRDVQSDNNDDYILGSIKFLHLDSSDMGYRDREYMIIKDDDDPGQTLEYLIRKWHLGAPKLVISLVGGFRGVKHMSSSVQKNFRRELVNAVLSTGAWLTTGGLHAGMTKDVGEALREYAIGRAMAEHRSVVALGIAPLSILKHKQKLTSGQGQKPIKYKIDPSDVTNAQLDPNHTHFLLVDDECTDRRGVEVDAQCKLLREISGRMIEGSNTAGIPVVCIVLGGGHKRIRAVHNAVVKNNIPVIVLEGSGGAADVIAFAYRHMNTKDINRTGALTWSLTASLSRAMVKVIREFNDLLSSEFGAKVESMHEELIECCQDIAQKSSLVTILPNSATQGPNVSSNIEENILNALLKAKSGSRYGDQLHLAAVLNRIDLAQKLLKEETCLQVTEVRQSLRFALANNQVKFVKLFLNKGLSIYEYLTVRELTSLYKMINKDTLLYELLDEELEKRGRRPVERWATLREVGNVIRRLTAWSYRPLYLRDEIADHSGRFTNPSRELFLWAILQGRLELANLFWREGKAPIGGALVASKLLKELADKEHNLRESRGFTTYSEGGRLYEELAVGVLDECYLSDRKRTSLIIVRTLHQWGSSNCLDLANSASNMKFIAHPAVQNMLKEFWMGKLSLGNPLWKVWLCLVFPPALLFIHLKLKDDEADPLVVKSLPRGTSKGTILIRKPVRRASTNVVARSRKWGLPSLIPKGMSKDDTDDKSHPREFGANFTGLPVRELNRRRAVKLDDYKPERAGQTKRRVSLARRIKQFFLVPLVIFLYNVFSIATFLALFSFTLLKGYKPEDLHAVEYLLLLWFFTLCTEIIRQIHREDAKTFGQRFRSWISNFWNIVDIVKSIIFIIGYVLRWFPDTMEVGRLVLAVALIIFYMRLLHIFSANKHLGPKLIMIQKMFADLLVFLCILLVFLVAYGVASEAILHPENHGVSCLLESVFYRPYIQMFGEGLLENEEFSNCTVHQKRSEYVWFGTILLAIYLFLSNVLLLNLLIAMFNYTFNAVQANTDVYWKYQRYKLINEYYKRPPLPPPFIIISHVYLFGIGLFKSILKVCLKCRKSTYCSCCRERRVFDPEFPSSLTQASMNEMTIWESVKGEDYLAKEQERQHQDVNKKLKNTDRRINELSEHMTKMVEDMSTVHEQLESIQSLLLEKLGPPKDGSEGSLDDIPDAATLALYKNAAGRLSPRFLPRQKKMQENE